MHLLFLRALRKIGLLHKFKLSSKLNLADRNFSIPVIHGLGINNLMMDEFWMLDLFKILSFSNNKLLLDIGSNVGQSLLKWKAIYPENTCYCFEPLQECVDYLEALISSNKLSNTYVLNKALWDSDEKKYINLHFDELGDRTASLLPSKFEVKKQIEINTISLNHFMLNYNISFDQIAIIKIDVEGAEYKILKALHSFLKEHNVYVIIEILSEQKSEHLNEIKKLIDGLAYDWYRIKKNGYHYSHLEKIQSIGKGIAISDSDYILIPKSLDTPLLNKNN